MRQSSQKRREKITKEKTKKNQGRLRKSEEKLAFIK